MTTTLTEKTFAELFTYAGAAQGTFTNAQGWIQPKPAGAVPRYDYDPLTKAPKGLLIESARTNVLTVSSRFEAAAWTKSNATVIPGAALVAIGFQTVLSAVMAGMLRLGGRAEQAPESPTLNYADRWQPTRAKAA